MSNYQWTISAGGTITSGGGTGDNTATVTWNTIGEQAISVNYTNTNTCTAASPTTNTVHVVSECAYNANTASAITNYIPCIDMPLNLGTVSSTFKTNQNFLMNVIQGLSYTLFTCNDPAPSSQIAITVYEEGNPGAGIIAASATHSGTLCSTAENNASVTFTATFSGQVRVLINEAGNCASILPDNIVVRANVNGGGNTLDNPSAAGTDSWVGHIYDGINFNNYLGYYPQSEIFQEGFGTSGTWPGFISNDVMCFNLLSDEEIRGSVRIRSFSVRYLMNTSREGSYLLSIGGDDANRLYVDGDLIYSDWSTHGPQIYDNVLLPLSGSNQLTLEYYENTGQNVLGFYNLRRIENTLTNNISQAVCLGESFDIIEGDDLNVEGAAIPAGITFNWQWYYSTTPGGFKIPITGATGQNYSPTGAPFDTPGTYYLFRAANISSTNNFGAGSSITSLDFSNMATLEVQTPPISGYANAARCGQGDITLSASALEGDVQWWDSSLEGNLLYTGDNFLINNLTNTTSYFLTSSSGACSSSRVEVIAYIDEPPVSAGAITGATGFYPPANQTYSVSPVLGMSYAWNAPAGWTQVFGGNSHSVIFNVPEGASSGIVSVIPSNSCGAGPASEVAVAVYDLQLDVQTISVCLSGGANTGSIIATGINGEEPYEYRRGTNPWQASGLFTGLTANNYAISVRDASGRIVSQNATLTATLVSGDDQTRSGDNVWIGHVYKRRDNVAAPPTDIDAYSDYYGTISANETFDSNFGGDQFCFQVEASEGLRTLRAEYIAIKYRMTSSHAGAYVVNIGSDDGARLFVDGDLVYNQWIQRSYNPNNLILFELDGNTDLVLDYYESSGGNRISFLDLEKIENQLTNTNEQSVCEGQAPEEITANNAFSDAPVSSNTGFTITYQWQLASDLAGPWSDISGATAQNLTPVESTTGTYYYRRAMTVAKENPGLPVGTNIPVVVTDYSDVFTLSIIPNAQITQQPVAPAPACIGSISTPLNVSATDASAYQWYSNTINSIIGASPVSGANLPGFAPTTATSGTTYYFCEIQPSNPACDNLYSNIVEVIIESQPSISISGGNQAICIGNNASPFTATITNGNECDIQWQYSTDAITWFDIPGANLLTYTPTGITTGAFFRAVTTNCSATCQQAVSNQFVVSAIHQSPTTVHTPVPETQTVFQGANISITCDAELGSGTTRYRLVLLSAYGAGWHGIQEIEGYNLAGDQIALSCTGASSATYTANPVGTSAYSALNAFDGVYNSASASGVQWLTPQNSSVLNKNYQNYTQFNPFYSPEWIEWDATEPLAQVWIYNGRYASGSSNTNFRDYSVWVSHNNGVNWHQITQGTMNNVQGIDGNNNKISLLPQYTWKKGATTVGTGRLLNIIAIQESSTYFMEATYGCGSPSVSSNAEVIVQEPGGDPVTFPVFDMGSSSVRCQSGETITYTATAQNATGISYSLDITSATFPGNSINALTGEVTFSPNWVGFSEIRAIASGYQGPKQSLHIVTTSANPGLSIANPHQTICEGGTIAPFTASLTNGSGCGVQWQESSDASTWNDITGAQGLNFTPAGVSSGTFYRAVTFDCAVGCNPAISNVASISVTQNPPPFSNTPNPPSQTVSEGSVVTITADADIASGQTLYRLILLSAHGTGYHGLQEIQGYNTSGSQVSLSCTGASSATGNDNPLATSAYSALNAFDGTFNSAASSGVQWLSPRSTAAPFLNYQNATSFNPFYSPEWIEWEAPEPLSEVWIYNGRYNTGTSNTTFRDYLIWMSNDNGATWRQVASGSMSNVQGLDNNNNKISVLPNYTWISNGSPVGNGRQLVIPGITESGIFHIEASYGCGTATVSTDAEVIVTTGSTDPVSTPVFTLGASSLRCQEADTITYVITVENETGVVFTLDATTQNFPGNSINTLTGTVIFSPNWIGTTTITATAYGYQGPKSASHTVNTLADPTVSITGGNQIICLGDDASPYTATVTNGFGCTVQWQSSADGLNWSNIPGAIDQTYTPAGLTTSMFLRAATVGCASDCDPSASNVFFIAVTHPAPAFTEPPVPLSATVVEGANISITCDANLGTGPIKYRLMLLSAYGAGWHGIQEIQGYTVDGTQLSLTCTGASSATYIANPIATSAFSAIRAFDGIYNSASASGVQWLTPQNTTAPNTNYKNYTQFNPFFSPEWIEWEATQPLAEVWVYNGRYASGTSNTNFRDYLIQVSHDNGSTWLNVAEGSMNNAQGLDGNNNKISVQPDYTWKTGATTVGTGRKLDLIAVSVSANYYVEATYGCGDIEISLESEITVIPPGSEEVEDPVFVAGLPLQRCSKAQNISFSATAIYATGISYTLDPNTLMHPGNSINAITGMVTFAADWAGTSTITAIASGTGGPKFAEHILVTHPNPSILVTGNSQTICAGQNALPLTASITNGVNCGIQWQISNNLITWTDITGANSPNYTPTGLLSSKYYRAITINCDESCTASISNIVLISVIHNPPTFNSPPSPQNQTVELGENVIITANATPGAGITRYRLVLLSAYGAGYHGIQEIVGYNAIGNIVPANCLNASSSTSNANPTGNHAYSARNAFDGTYNSTQNSWVQWLSPQSNLPSGANYQNYTSFSPFYSPEWVEWETPQPLSEIWIYNGRYSTGSSSTNFRDYTILVSHDEGATWHSVAAGSMNNVSGIDGHNNKISIEPGYTWKKGAATVGVGRELILPTIAYSDAGTYNAEATYGCGSPSTSSNATVTVVAPTLPPVEIPVFIMGNSSERCRSNEVITYTATAVNATGISYQADAVTLAHPGNYFNILTGELEFAADWTGVTTITAYAGGEGGPQTNTHTISTVVSPTINLTGNNQIICSGDDANELTATIANGVGCQIKWQRSNDAINWIDIPGENNANYTPVGLTSSQYYRATTINCASNCTDAVSRVVFVAVNKPSPSLSIQPTPSNQNICPGDNASIEAQANLGSGTKRYRLVLLSAYGNAWHGIQEIQGYNLNGNPVSLSCTGASSATYTSSPTNPSAYSALNAFDGVFNSSSASGVQWLTPQNSGSPNTNWQNYTNINPFYSPEWIEWEASEALAEVWIYNGRYASGASGTNFRDYRILESTDAGSNWHLVANGTMANVQGLNGNNNKISVEPDYTWFNSETAVVGSGKTLQLNNISTANTYHVEVSYGCTPFVSDEADIVLDLSVGGTLSGSTTVQAPSNSTLLELSGQTGSVIKWQWSENETDWTDIANTTTSYTAINLLVTTYFRVEVQNGSCTSTYSSTAVIAVSDLSFTLSRVTLNNQCPELDWNKGFNANQNGPYNAGATEIVFKITRTPAVAATWEFDYIIEDATVSSIGSSPNPQTGTISGLSGADYDTHFYITNQPGSAINVKFKVTAMRDSNGGTDNTEREVTTTIAPMPGIGIFN
jgi:hypothetical protein